MLYNKKEDIKEEYDDIVKQVRELAKEKQKAEKLLEPTNGIEGNEKILRKIKFPFEFDATKLCTDELQKKILPVKERLIELEKKRNETKVSSTNEFK